MKANFFNSNLFRIILILLVIGVMLTAFGVSDFIDSRKEPIKYEELTATQLKKGAIIEGDIYYNLGQFETIEHQKNGVTQSTDYRYVIPIGDDFYAGFEALNNEMVTSLDTQTDETYDYLDGKIEDTTTVVHFTGKVQKLNDEDYGFFKEMMVDYLGFTESEFTEKCPKYLIEAREFGKTTPLMFVGIILLLIAIGLIVFVVLQFKKASSTAGAGVRSVPGNSYDANSMMNQGPMVNQNPTMNQGPMMNQNPTMNQDPMMNQNPTMNQGPMMNQNPTMNQDPMMNQNPTMNQDPMMNQGPQTDDYYGNNSNY